MLKKVFLLPFFSRIKFLIISDIELFKPLCATILSFNEMDVLNSLFPLTIRNDLFRFLAQSPSMVQLYAVATAMVTAIAKPFREMHKAVRLPEAEQLLTVVECVVCDIAWDVKLQILNMTIPGLFIERKQFTEELTTLMRIPTGIPNIYNEEFFGDWFVVTVYLLSGCSYEKSYWVIYGFFNLPLCELRKGLAFVWPAIGKDMVFYFLIAFVVLAINYSQIRLISRS